MVDQPVQSLLQFFVLLLLSLDDLTLPLCLFGKVDYILLILLVLHLEGRKLLFEVLLLECVVLELLVEV